MKMNIKKFVPSSVTTAVAKQTLKIKHNSPHILFGAGIAGVVAGTVLACRATLKVGDVLDEMQDDVEAVKRDMNDPKDVAYAYGHGTLRIARLYAPAVIVTSVSIAALTKSHVTLTKRNGALTAAYTGLHTAFENYRERVREEVGEERELDIFHGTELEKIKKGNKTETKKIVDPAKISQYSRFFDESSLQWRDNAELNLFFLRSQQNYFNDILHAQGFVFLNDVYKALGFPLTDAGQIMGWVIDEDTNNFIDFGIYEAYNKDFINGGEPCILLTFNIDGVVYGRIDKKKG